MRVGPSESPCGCPGRRPSGRRRAAPAVVPRRVRSPAPPVHGRWRPSRAEHRCASRATGRGSPRAGRPRSVPTACRRRHRRVVRATGQRPPRRTAAPDRPGRPRAAHRPRQPARRNGRSRWGPLRGPAGIHAVRARGRSGACRVPGPVRAVGAAARRASPGFEEYGSVPVLQPRCAPHRVATGCRADDGWVADRFGASAPGIAGTQVSSSQ
jgi:hypothetical protein